MRPRDSDPDYLSQFYLNRCYRLDSIRIRVVQLARSGAFYHCHHEINMLTCDLVSPYAHLPVLRFDTTRSEVSDICAYNQILLTTTRWN